MRYRVVQRPQSWSEKNEADGMCYVADQLIEVNKTLAPERGAMILLHEILHACWDAAELPGNADEENAVSGLARALYVTLRDNPKLLRYLNLAK